MDIKNVRKSIRDYDEDEIIVIQSYTLVDIQQTIFLTEFGLYKLLFKSIKLIAKTFQKWVFNVLQSYFKIRFYQYYAQIMRISMKIT